MTNFVNRVLMTAAVAAVTTGAAWAGESLNVNIPFAFSAGGSKLAAGEYRVGPHDPRFQGVIQLRNVSTGAIVLANSAFPVSSERHDNRLVFRCGEHGCTLTQVWNGSNGLELKPRIPVSSEDRVAVVPMHKTSAGGF